MQAEVAELDARMDDLATERSIQGEGVGRELVGEVDRLQTR